MTQTNEDLKEALREAKADAELCAAEWTKEIEHSNTLESLLSEALAVIGPAQTVLADLTQPDMKASILTVYARCVEAETRLRAFQNKAVGR